MSRKKKILITGASGLIGSQLCRKFLEAGWEVYGQVHQGITDVEMHVIRKDLSKPSTGRELVEQIEGIDAIINNAADQSVENLATFSSIRAHEMLQVNFLSPMEIILAARSKGATLAINISSIEALNARAGHETYGATKAALESVTRSLANALSPMRIHGIRLGLIGDDNLSSRWPEGFNSWTEKVASHRIGSADEVAKLALALSDETFAFATGSIFDFDGGKSAAPGW
jgi:3-oxoacyl-[acyl-carrier protein] reductase